MGLLICLILPEGLYILAKGQGSQKSIRMNARIPLSPPLNEEIRLLLPPSCQLFCCRQPDGEAQLPEGQAAFSRPAQLSPAKICLQSDLGREQDSLQKSSIPQKTLHHQLGDSRAIEEQPPLSPEDRWWEG